jgi:sRNA-binding regulator protein Hfq
MFCNILATIKRNNCDIDIFLRKGERMQLTYKSLHVACSIVWQNEEQNDCVDVILIMAISQQTG